MRTLLTALALSALAATLSACASGSNTSSAATPDNNEPTKPCLLKSAGRDLLRLTVPADTVVTPQDGFLDLKSRDRYVEIWLVRGAQTLKDAAARAPKAITDEFKDFVPAKTVDLTVAGSPAKRLMGDGTEADDGDPGHADVIVFQTGDNFFIACTHGEYLSPVSQKWLLALVQTAQKP